MSDSTILFVLMYYSICVTLRKRISRILKFFLAKSIIYPSHRKIIRINLKNQSFLVRNFIGFIRISGEFRVFLIGEGVDFFLGIMYHVA